MLDQQRIIMEAYTLDVAVSQRQAALLDAYCTDVAVTNQSLNLTAITEPRDMEIKHVLDCMVLCGMPELTGNVADVGTGAGFPGVVLKIMRPELDVTLIDSTAKKLAFIERACNKLDIDVKTVHGRAEELARGQTREQYDTVVARAVAPLCALVEYCLPLVKPGGWLLAMKGSEVAAELAESGGAIVELGGEAGIVENFVLSGDIRRAVVKIKKISQTPSKYPRIGKNITKSPLKNR